MDSLELVSLRGRLARWLRPARREAGSLASAFARGHDTLVAAEAAMPTATEIQHLREQMSDARQRGWFTPAEDDEIRGMLSRYLHVRSALHDTLSMLEPHAPRWFRRADPDALRAFATAWLAGCILMRTARFVIREFYADPKIRAILNQAEPRYGIPANILTQIHASASRPSALLRFLRAARFAEIHAASLNAIAEDDPLLADILNLLAAEKPWIETQKRQFALEAARFRWSRIRAQPKATYHRVLWGIFETSGRAIAEMRNPFHRKRVNANIRQLVSDTLQPCDLLITRHDDALSNLFLPGFWPHTALVIGHEAQRTALGVQMDPDRTIRAQPPCCILEAKKDGVRFRALNETLEVDAFILLRPRIATDALRRQIIEQAVSHEGKLYDFVFDFSRPGKLVCTEVIYRAFDGMGDLRFDLTKRAGRYTLSAEDLLRQGLASDSFEVVMVYGLQGNQVHRGERAREMLTRSLHLPASAA